MNLFSLSQASLNLTQQIEAIADRLDDDPSSIDSLTADLEALLAAEEANTAALDAKADATCWVIDRLRAHAAAREAHAARLQRLADGDTRRAAALEGGLIRTLQRLQPDATKWDLASHRLVSRRSTSVVVSGPPEGLPQEFQRVTTTTTADKAAIKAAIKAGRTIPGASLEERRTWSIQ